MNQRESISMSVMYVGYNSIKLLCMWTLSATVNMLSLTISASGILHDASLQICKSVNQINFIQSEISKCASLHIKEYKSMQTSHC